MELFVLVHGYDLPGERTFQSFVDAMRSGSPSKYTWESDGISSMIYTGEELIIDVCCNNNTGYELRVDVALSDEKAVVLKEFDRIIDTRGITLEHQKERVNEVLTFTRRVR